MSFFIFSTPLLEWTTYYLSSSKSLCQFQGPDTTESLHSIPHSFANTITPKSEISSHSASYFESTQFCNGSQSPSQSLWVILCSVLYSEWKSRGLQYIWFLRMMPRKPPILFDQSPLSNGIGLCYKVQVLVILEACWAKSWNPLMIRWRWSSSRSTFKFGFHVQLPVPHSQPQEKENSHDARK